MTITRMKTLSALSTTLIAALTASCSLPVEEEPIAETTEALAYSEFHWTKGDPAEDMGSTSNRHCFLGKVLGDFDGGGEFVEVVKSSDRWVLRGGSGTSHTIGATAYCRTGSATAERTWTKGSSTISLSDELGVDAQDSCFLTRVKGAFNGGGERVFTRFEDGEWILGGASGASNTLSVSARCLTNRRLEHSADWHQNDSLDHDVLKNQESDSSQLGCFLMGMQGQFEGGGEAVAAYYYGPSDAFFVGGSSGQFGVAAWAGCSF